jgi:nitroreductase
MEFDKIVSERYSVRKFEQKHLKKEIIDKIIAAGHLAPTGCNYQPQRIVVINTDESIEKLKLCTRSHFGAQCALLVCYNKEETWKRPYDGALSAPVDASIVTTFMMLKAQDLGIGTCWVMHFDPEAMKDTFRIPNHIEPLALLVMGYPSENATPLPLHFDSRPLGETVVYESF